MLKTIPHVLLALSIAAAAGAEAEEDRAAGSLPYLANASSLIVEAAALSRVGTTEKGSSLVEAEVREVLKGELGASTISFLVPVDLAAEDLRPCMLFLDENYAKTLGGKLDQPDYVVVSGRLGIVPIASPDRLSAVRGYLAAPPEEPYAMLSWAADHSYSPDPLLSVASFYELARLLPVEAEPDLFPAYWGLSDPPRRELLEEAAELSEEETAWSFKDPDIWGTDFLEKSVPELLAFLRRADPAITEQLGALSSLANRADELSRSAIHELIVDPTQPFELRKAALISIATQTPAKRGDLLLEIHNDLSPDDPLYPYLDVLEP